MIISAILVLSLSFLLNPIDSSVTFEPNPGCDVLNCTKPDQPALFYANHTIGDDVTHMLLSSFGELTITVFQTKKTSMPTFNYTALYLNTYNNSITFSGAPPSNSFTLAIRSVIEFNDAKDTGVMDGDNAIKSYSVKDSFSRNNFSLSTTKQPSFEYQSKELNGSLKIDVVYPGETTRDTNFPKLQTEPASFFLDIVFQANKYSFPNPRIAFEFWMISPNPDGYNIKKSRNIDDQYTPGIFNVWQLQPNPKALYSSSMLWKPVIYQSDDRSVEDTTLMHVYKLQNHVTYDPADEGIYLSFLPQPYISALNISVGASQDGFFTKANYSFLQITAGLDDLQPDATGKFITVAVIVSFSLPAIVGIISVIFTLKRRFSSQSPLSTYNQINN